MNKAGRIWHLLAFILMVGCIPVPEFDESDLKNDGLDEGVLPNNSAPEATSKAFSTLEDTTLTSNLQFNDQDGTGRFSITIVSSPSNGTLTLTSNSTGAFSYHPNANFFGTDTFSYEVRDLNFTSGVTPVEVEVIQVDDLITAVDTTITVTEDLAFVGNVSFNDVDSDNISITIITNGTRGSASIINASTGEFQYTPSANQIGTDFFTFRVNDGLNSSNLGIVSVALTPVNDDPIIGAIANQSAQVAGTAISNLAFTFGEGGGSDEDTQQINITAKSSNQLIVPDANITFGSINDTGGNDADATTATVTVTPLSDAVGAVTITIIATDNADANSTFSETFIIPYLPSTSGLKLWLDASETEEATDGIQVSSWPDLSGAGNHFVQTFISFADLRPVRHDDVVNSLPIVRFNGVSQFMFQTITGSAMFGTNEGTFFVVAKQDSTKTTHALMSFLATTTTNMVELSYSDNNTLGLDFGNKDDGSGNITGPISTGFEDSFHLVEYFRDAGGAGKIEVDGVEVFHSAFTGDFDNTQTSTLFLGRGSGTADQFFQGDIAEVLVFNNAIPEMERFKIERYLGDKYGLSIKQDPIVSASGLSLWLKADAGVNKTTTSTLSQWEDQSGSGNHSTAVPGLEGPVIVTSLPGFHSYPVIRFNGTSHTVSFPDFISGFTEAEAFVVFKLDSSAPAVGAEGLWHFGSDGSSAEFPENGTGLIKDTFGASSQQNLANTTLDFSTGFNIYHVRAKANEWTAWYNGNLLFNSTTSNTISFTTTPKFGSNNTGTSFLDGDVAELIIYDRELTPNQRYHIEAALGLKYGVATQSLTKNSAWYRSDVEVFGDACAGTSATNAGVVQCWEDQRTGANDLTAPGGGNQPTFNNNIINQLGVISFDGSTDCLRNNLALGTTLFRKNAVDIFTVQREQALQTSNLVLNWEGGTDNLLEMFQTTNEELQLVYGDSGNNNTLKASMPSGFNSGFHITKQGRHRHGPGHVVVDGTEIGNHFFEGTLNTSTTLANFNVGGDCLLRGIQGDLAEVMIYNDSLTEDEFNRVNFYLSEKYNLPIASHPVNSVQGLKFWLKADAGILVGPGGAASFASTNNEYLTAADNTDFSIGQNSFSISTWVQIANKNNNYSFVAKYDVQDNSREYVLRYNRTDDRFEFVVSNNGKENGEIVVQADSLGSPNVGEFYHLVATHNSVTDVITLVVNNRFQDTSNFVFNVFDGSSVFTIGASGEDNDDPNANIAATHFYLDGRVALTGFWKKTLSSTERSLLYNGGAGLRYRDIETTSSLLTSLISYYNLDDAAGGNRLDSHTAVGPYHLSERVAAGNIDLGEGVQGVAVGWNDQSFNGFNFAPASNSVAPIIVADSGDGLNNRPAVRFDGVDDLVSSTIVTASSNYTFIVVASYAANTANMEFFDSDTGAERLRFDAETNVTAGQLGFFTNFDGLSEQPLSSGPQLLSYVLTQGTGGSIFRDGTLIGAGTYNTSTGINGSANIGQLFRGDIAEVILYNQALSTEELNRVQCYLASKYNITVANCP